MKIHRTVITAAMLCIIMLMCGCSGKNSVSDSDATSSFDVSSSLPVSAENYVEIYAGDVKIEDCFLLNSFWNGEEYKSGYSLNQIMMEKYLPEDSVIPQAVNKSIIQIKFIGNDELTSIKLTQHANTLKSNTGMSYKIKDIELQQKSDKDYSFEINFESFPMYYYQLECAWKNGNTATYAFALEATKK